MIVLGFDQATKNTGFSVVKKGKLKDHGVLSTSSESESRIEDMFYLIKGKIDSVNPDVVVVEDSYYSNNGAVFKALSSLKGMIWSYCLIHDIKFIQYNPPFWRSKAGIKEGKGVKRAELKSSAVDFVKEKFNVECSDDEAEAIVISYIGYNEVYQ